MELATELDEVHKHVCDQLISVLRTFEASSAMLDYVASLRLYMRSAHLLTLWTPDRALRSELTCDLAMHIVAMKLFDDLLDDDSGMDRYDLGFCLLLQNRATRNLASRAGDAQRILAILEEDFMTIGVGQVRTKREPAQDLPEWRAHASTYGACFLGCYGTLAAISGGVPEAADAANDLGRGFGMIVTVADDLRDYERKGERAGNLGHLLLSGRTTVAAVTALLEEMRTLATRNVGNHPAAHDVASVVDTYANDILERMLPIYRKRIDWK